MQVTNSNRLARLWRHLLSPTSQVLRTYGTGGLQAIEQAIGNGERRHTCEIRFVVESNLDSSEIWNHVQPRLRAKYLFSQLNVWDTAGNNGVLLYVLLADRSVDIVVDRAISAVLPDTHWRRVIEHLTVAYKSGDFVDSTIRTLDAISMDLAEHFPASSTDVNELSNKTTLI